VSLEVRPWSGFAALAALGPDWDRLAREAGLDPLCNAHAWCEAYARAWSTDADVLGWTFHERGETVGIVALRREPPRGALALRRALFVADGSFDSDYLDAPIRPGLEAAVASALFEAARRVRGLEVLVFAGMPEGSRFLAALRAELARRALVGREHEVACLAVSLGDDYERYLGSLKPRIRTKVRSAVRGAEERGARLAWCQRAEDLDAWLAELFRLHGLRWQAEGHGGALHDPRRQAFYAALARSALARGELCFARLEEDGAVHAMQFGVRTGERYYQIQEGFDPVHEGQRVGTALRGLAVRELIARGIRAYDFMAGDSRHKRDWGGSARPCTTIACPLPRWRPRLAYQLRARVEHWRSRSSEPG